MVLSRNFIRLKIKSNNSNKHWIMIGYFEQKFRLSLFMADRLTLVKKINQLVRCARPRSSARWRWHVGANQQADVADSPHWKIKLISNGGQWHQVSDIKLTRTYTTLDLSQKVQINAREYFKYASCEGERIQNYRCGTLENNSNEAIEYLL